jgi:NitT/TauT family transport system substrate-binding protein
VDRRVAALSINIFTYGGFENRGAKLRYMSTPEVEPILGWGLATTGPYLEANREEAVKLARGFHRGHLFCRANPEQCVQLFLKRFPTVRTPGIPEEQIAKDQLRLLGKFIEYAPQAPNQPWGWYDQNSWKTVIDYMVVSHQLPKPIPQ